VLLYHVINGEVMSTELTDGLVAPTFLGGNVAYQNTVTASLVDSTVGFYDSMGGKALVSTADIEASNGVIHIVDAVLIPGGTVNEVTANVPTLSALDGALRANGLNDTLALSANYTLFAPSNDAVTAFVADNGVIDADLLTYHVLADRFLSINIPEGETTLPTLNADAQVTVINNGSGVFVRDVRGRVGQVTTANLNTMNGVVHIIDIVLDDVATTTTTV